MRIEVERVGLLDMEVDPLCVGRSLYVSRPWLTATARLRSSCSEYLLARDESGRLLGALPVYFGDTSIRGYYDPYSRFLGRAGVDARVDDWRPTLVVGSRSAYCNEFLVDQHLEVDASTEVLAALLDSAWQLSGVTGATSLSALYLTEVGAGQITALGQGHHLFLAGANCVLDLDFDSLSDYLHSDGPRGQRRRRERRAFLEAGYRVTVETLQAASLPTVADLMGQMDEKYGHRSDPDATVQELSVLLEEFGNSARLLCAWLGDTLTGVVLLLMDTDTVYCRSAGFDYAVTGHAFEYFNLTYYEAVEYALTLGAKRIDYGMASYQAKLARGCRLEARYGVVVSRSAGQLADNAAFEAWDRGRRQALASGRGQDLDEAELP